MSSFQSSLACLFLLLFFSFNTSAQEKEKWERVYTLEDATIAMNSTRVEFVGDEGTARVWFRWNFSKQQSMNDASKASYKTRVETVEFNCNRRRYRLVAYTLLDSKGKELFSKELESWEREWKTVKAGGMMERLFSPACKLIEEKRK